MTEYLTLNLNLTKRILFCIIVLSSCTNNKVNIPSEKHVDISKIQGVWKEIDAIEGLFTIKGDSIYTIGSPKPEYCKIDNDTLKISYDNYNISKFKILKLNSDSLELLNIDNKKLKYYKIRSLKSE